MELNKTLMNELKDIIIRKIREEFAIYHLTGNLVNTIKVEQMSDEIKIEIPAPIYDLIAYKSQKVIIYKKSGSYASELNENGSFKGHHKGYIDRIINLSIVELEMKYAKDIEKVERS